MGFDYLEAPPVDGTFGQVVSLDAAGVPQYVDPESRGQKLRRLARQAKVSNPFTKPYMRAELPWQPNTVYYQTDTRVHGGTLFTLVSVSGTSGSTGPTNLLPAGGSEGTGCIWIANGTNVVTNDPSLNIITRTDGLTVTAGQLLRAGNNVYAVTVGGNLGTGDPTGTGIGIIDGGATLSYYGRWRPVPFLTNFPTFTSLTSTPSGTLPNYYSPSVFSPGVGAISAKPISGGSNYQVGDLITIANGAVGVNSAACVLRVETVAAGVIKSVSVSTPGVYTALPAYPTTQASATGSGSGATFAVRWPEMQWGRIRGGYPVGASSANRTLVANFTPADNVAPKDKAIAFDFMTDAPIVAILCGTSTPHYAVFVDGERWNFSGFPNNTVTSYWQQLDFEVKKTRHIRLEGISNLDIRGVRVDAKSQVWKPDTLDQIVSVWISDSICDGSAYAPFVSSLTHRIGHLLGHSDVWCLAQGGTGYVNAGTGSTYGYRIPEALTLNPDVWNFFGSTNDGIYTPSQVQAAALACFQAIRNGGSNSPILVHGLISVDDSSYVAGKKIADFETALQAAVDAMNDPQIWFIPFRNLPVPMLTVAGVNNQNASGSSNADEYINGTDKLHPRDLGLEYMAAYIANEDRKIFQRMK